MSDADLRALERRWRESASVEDETRWHAARLRVGLVTERGLVIAAGLGHEASLRLAPAVGLSPLELFDRPEAEPHAPTDSGRIRAAVGLARAMAARFVDLLPAEVERMAPSAERIASVRASVAAAERWVRSPCPDHAAGLVPLPGVVLNDCIPACCWYEADFPGLLVGLALDVIAEHSVRAPRRGWPIETVAQLFDPGQRDQRLADGMPDGLERAAEDAIRAAVIPWALGLPDPLLDAP